MKKLVLFLLSVILCLSTLITMTACSKDTVHPIDAFVERMENEKNCQLAITYHYPSVGSFGFKMKLDGSIIYIPDFSILGQQVFEETYIKTTNKAQYVYTKNAYGSWIKEKIDLSDDSDSTFDDDSLNLEDIFDSKKYVKVKGEENTYKQKSNALFEDAEDVVIVIEDDFCTVEMSMMSEGIVIDVKIVFSRFGEIDLSLPKVN